MPALMSRINSILQDYLAVVFCASMLVVGTSVGYFWVSHVQVIERVTANEVGVSRNQDLGEEVHDALDLISGAINRMAIDMAIVREKVSNLEKR